MIWRSSKSIAPRPTTGIALGTLFFVLIHIPLGLGIARIPAVTFAHIIVVMTVGLAWACVGRSEPYRVACVAGYVTGSEVLWRMGYNAGARIPWELGKYGVATICFAWMVRNKQLKVPVMAMTYLVLLLPSIVVSLLDRDMEDKRQLISFNLSGPLALMVAVWFFSQVRLSSGELRHLCVSVVAPLIGLASVTVVATFLNPNIAFGTESNMEASGGFGPNQVSTALGLGALFGLIALSEERRPWLFRPILLICVAVLASQCAFTFSRGGLIIAAAAAVLGCLQFMRDDRYRFKTIAAITFLVLVGVYVLFPAMNSFTDGALSTRFQDVGFTNRDAIASADLEIWRDNLVLGVGPGRANGFRAAYFRYAAAHTEYTRMLAEHGLFGLCSLIALAVMVFQVMRQPGSIREKALTSAMFAWGLMFLAAYGMRLVAPAFVIGLASMHWAERKSSVANREARYRRGVVAMAHIRRRLVGSTPVGTEAT
jgi:hypothetical protein